MNAVAWLKSQPMENTYTMAVTAYAMTLYKADIYRDTLVQRLWQRSVNEGKTNFYHNTLHPEILKKEGGVWS